MGENALSMTTGADMLLIGAGRPGALLAEGDSTISSVIVEI
jgi:hypothetical protein